MTALDRAAVVALILECAQEINETVENPIAIAKGEHASLFGGDGVLDSLGLVSLVVAVEQELEDRFSLLVDLADEKAISARRSPFSTVATLADYILDKEAFVVGRP